MIKVLVSAYACGPNWGSEVGMGWNWVIALSNHCKLTIITELGFKSDIELVLDRLELKYIPTFYYIDIGDNARAFFWKQGDWRFYKSYKMWHQKAYLLAENLIGTEEFDIVHQLNMIGYREPGYLWKLPLAKIWGPIGGHAQMPWRYMSLLSNRAVLYYSLRNLLNSLQMRLSPRVVRAMHNFDVLIAATMNDQKAINNIHHREVVIVNETGSKVVNCELNSIKIKVSGECTRLVWSGFLKGGKALPILLHALVQLPDRSLVHLDIIGDGPERNSWQSLAISLGVGDVCTWHGRVNHSDALEIMKNSDVLVFTSLLEGTPAVVLEALSFGLPIICHDTCGFGAIVDETCGIKVPVVSTSNSIKEFSDAILALVKDPSRIERLREGALSTANKITWDKKALQMVELYKELLIKRALV